MRSRGERSGEGTGKPPALRQKKDLEMARPKSAPRLRPPLGLQVSRCQSDPIYTVATEELEEVAWNVFPRKQTGLELRTKMAFVCGHQPRRVKAQALVHGV